ncbi:type VII secretion-associated serine protease mycosin [Kitasatospora sp. NPDC052896]|uniref:type VII secretion-associated serine protease mycosin n=1 Tax=Kitasatospora sp. NPDC052896 TaxID=3364061 RepID=UPI0037C7CBBB
MGPLLTGALLAVGPGATAADGGDCGFPAKPIPGTPWALQRIPLAELREQSTGRGVKVAVIDSGVDVVNPQLAPAVSTGDGFDVLDPAGNGTRDDFGHGTKVAGIIAARPLAGTGFVGLAPEAALIAVRQNDGHGNGPVEGLATAIDRVVAEGAKVVNISQETALDQDPPPLRRAVGNALAADVVIVAAAGNDGATGRSKVSYPAAYPGVLAVAATDRDNERAPFSQRGGFVGVAAPGVDIVSTVPAGGHCTDQGTSFAAPYAAGVAALIRAKHPSWTAREVVAQIEQTAQRTDGGRNDSVGWGVVDPLAALTRDTAGPVEAPTPDPDPPAPAGGVTPVAVSTAAPESGRRIRDATCVVATGFLAIVLIAGVATVQRDLRGHRDRRDCRDRRRERGTAP